MSEMTLLTAEEKIAVVKHSWQNYLDKKDNSVDDAIAFVKLVNADVQVRDYLLGMPKDLVAEGMELDTALMMMNEWLCGTVLALKQDDESMVEGVIREDMNPFLTLTAVFRWELGDVESAKQGLSLVEGDYSLANLISRCIDSGQPATIINDMRASLHQKVVENL